MNPYRNLALACNIVYHRPQYNPSTDLFRIPIFNKAIKVNRRDSELYLGRGVAYFDDGAFEEAIDDLSEALRLDPNIGPAYSSRALAWLCLQEPDNSLRDLAKANSLDYDFVPAFFSEHKSVADFEQKYSIKVPENISDMLMGAG